MSDYEVIKTEYTDGSFKGVYYGSKVRIMMRSPVAILFVGYGLNMIKRDGMGAHSHISLSQDSKRVVVEHPEIRAKIVEMFGEGSDEAALAAFKTRGMGTVLFDGGGDPLPLVRAVAAKQIHAEYADITATRHVDIETKCCIQCGDKLPLKTVHHHMGSSPSGDNHPKTVEDCQRLSNQPVVAVHGYEINSPDEWWTYISWFETWDGESYRDDTFCSDRCAAVYGRRAVAELPSLEVGGEAPVKKATPYERVSHYEEVVRVTASGIKY